MVSNKHQRLHSLPKLQTFRTELRQHLTPAEATLWKYLQGSKLEGRKFRRQHSVGNYILDFYCPTERLGIELDGEVHNSDQAMAYDHERKLFLKAFDIKVLRFENKFVFDEIEWVLHRIKTEFGWYESARSAAKKLPSLDKEG
jgi:very-short-patch-repair endonuclease